jgi:ATP-binding cassette subfamily F protein 3
VADGGVTPFDGDMNDYRRYVLEQSGAISPSRKKKAKAMQAAAIAAAEAEAAEQAEMRATITIVGAAKNTRKIVEAEEKIARLNGLLARVDTGLANPNLFRKDPKKAAELTRQRGELEKALILAEEAWIALS